MPEERTGEDLSTGGLATPASAVAGRDHADGEEIHAFYVELSSERDLRRLADAILDPSRDYPIICLTARPGEGHPALDPAAVREIAGDAIPIYFVCTRRLTRYLGNLLPPRFDVWDGATRIWWPGVHDSGDPIEHPRIYDPSGRYGEDCMQRLAEEFATPSHPELTIKQQFVLAERQRSQLAARAAGLERTLARTRQELDQALKGTAQSTHGNTTQEADLEPGTPSSTVREQQREESPRSGESDIEGKLYKLIWSDWVDICPSDERAEHPPRRFVIDRELIRIIVQRRIDVPIERIAWVCAMVISDRAVGHTSIDAHIYRGSEETERADGAKAMRAALKRSAGGPRLHYWSLPNGTIEFTKIGYHDMTLQ